jgi:hypothetical protein
MARQTISAEIRGHVFRIRADWADPESPIEIENQGYEWEETGETVSDYPRREKPTDSARWALAAVVQEFHDDWRSIDLTTKAILAVAVLEEDA